MKKNIRLTQCNGITSNLLIKWQTYFLLCNNLILFLIHLPWTAMVLKFLLPFTPSKKFVGKDNIPINSFY